MECGRVQGLWGSMDSIRPELLRMGRSEQVCRQDERAEGVVGRGGEDRGAVWRPLSAFKVVALILGLGPLCWAKAGFKAITQKGSFFDPRFGYAALVEVSCCAYESRLGMVGFVHGGRRFLIVRDCAHGGRDLGALTMQSNRTFRQPSRLDE